MFYVLHFIYFKIKKVLNIFERYKIKKLINKAEKEMELYRNIIIKRQMLPDEVSEDF